MVVIRTAITLPFNPPSIQQPTITAHHAWAGLVQKCVRPQDGFVKVFSDCEVVSRTETEIVRVVTFKPGMGFDRDGKGGKFEERIVLEEGLKAEFFQPSGTVVSNIISVGPNGPDDLHLTFTFAAVHGEIAEGDEPGQEEKRKFYVQTGVEAVRQTVERIRGLVREGSL